MESELEDVDGTPFASAPHPFGRWLSFTAVGFSVFLTTHSGTLSELLGAEVWAARRSAGRKGPIPEPHPGFEGVSQAPIIYPHFVLNSPCYCQKVSSMAAGCENGEE